MGTIPANDIVQVVPSVLPAAGSNLALIGLILSSGTRIPLNGTDNPVILSFPSALAVASYFGASSTEAAVATTYFLGNANSQQKPGNVLFAQYNLHAVSAYLRGGPGLTLAAVQAIVAGNIEVIVDGFAWDALAINLSAATSLSNAAAILQSDLAAPANASITASIATQLTSTQGLMTVTVVASGTLAVGQVVAGSSVAANTVIAGYGTGTGGTGTYLVSVNQTVGSEAMTTTQAAASFTASLSGNVLTVTAMTSGTIVKGQLLAGASVAAGTVITAGGTGIGQTGTYKVNNSQTVSSEAMTTSPQPPTVTYDSVSGGFVFTSSTTGFASTIAFATKNDAALLMLTAATGAVLSQGAAAADPTGYMNSVILTTQNWASFMTTFDPDGGAEPPTQKLLFAQWANSTADYYLYVALDSDILPTQSTAATGSFGYLIGSGTGGNNYSGTAAIWSGTSDLSKPAFVCGTIASIAFTQTNGRITLKFKQQTGLVADVTSETVADNLRANGYNFYGAWATRANNFVFFADGVVSGPFDWIDSYVDQIWFNDALQVAILNLFQNVRSIPYNQAGNSLMRAACLDPINTAVNFGAIVAGVVLSAAQIAEINNAAGNTQAANAVQTQGWYLQIGVASASTRAARQSPPCTLWYADGESIQQLIIDSIDVQ